VSCRVTVVGARRRLDADLPASIPVVELLADVAGLLGETVNGAALEWGLLKVGGARLDPELSLADQGVADGAMLFLRDVTTAPAAPAMDDYAGRVALVVDAQRDRWSPAVVPAVLAWIAAASLAAAGSVVLVAGDAGGRVTAGALGGVIGGLAALALVRVLRRHDLAEVVMLSSLPSWAAAGAGVAGLVTADGPTAVAVALAFATAGALVTAAVEGEAVVPLADGVVEASAPPALVVGIAAALGAKFLQAAAVLVVVELVMLATMPVVTSRLLMSQRVAQGRTVATASRIASTVVIVASCAVLASSGSWFARALIAATAIAAVLRARHNRFVGEIAPLLAAGIVSLILLELPLASWLAVGIHGAAGLALLFIGDAVVLVGASVLVRRWSLPARVTRWLRPLEFVAVAATVPLALGVLGLYDAVAHFVRGLG
jgi:hypothetical protein